MGTRTLRITSGPAAGQSVEIEAELVIGRENADVTVEDSELSRRHLVLRSVGQGVEIEDLGSLNGTFVNGRQISRPHLMDAPGTLKFGLSQATVEVSLPRATPVAETPAGPGTTVARPIPGVQHEAPQPLADPEGTVERPLVDPEETAPRPAQTPDVAAKPSPTDDTVRRPAGSAGPPPGTVRPPARPPPPPKDASERSNGPPVPLIVGGIVALIVIGGLVLTSGRGEDAQTRKVSMTLNLGTATAEDKRLSELRPGRKAITWKLYGRARGRPFGTGSVSATATLEPGGPPPGKPAGRKPPPGKPKPAMVTARRVLRFPGGSLKVAERIQSLNRGERLEFDGTGRILSGTGDFAGAKGTLKVTGARPNFRESAQTLRWTGSVEY